jgi:hypothetical protein
MWSDKSASSDVIVEEIRIGNVSDRRGNSCGGATTVDTEFNLVCSLRNDKAINLMKETTIRLSKWCSVVVSKPI